MTKHLQTFVVKAIPKSVKKAPGTPFVRLAKKNIVKAKAAHKTLSRDIDRMVYGK